MNSGFNRAWAVALLAVVVMVVGVFLPVSVLTPLNYIGLHALVCLGLVLMTGMAGLTSFGQAAFVGLGAYTSAVLVTSLGWSPWLSLPAALLVSGGSAYVLGWLTISLSSHYLVLGTMAWGISLYNLFGNLKGLGGYNGIGGIPAISIPGLDLQNAQTFFLLIWVFNGFAFLFARNLLDSRIGRAIRSLKDPLMAQSFGVWTTRLNVSIFVIAAVLAGLAGWLHAHYVTVVNPGPFGVGASIDYLFMAVVGGTSSLAGALVGPVVVELLRTVVRDTIPGLTGVGGSFEIMVFGIVVILLLRGSGNGLAALLFRGKSAGRAPVAPDRAKAYEPRTKPDLGSALLNVKGLTKRYGGLTAVDQVDFDVVAGELLGVIGPNGAGKSSLFNVLTGVISPSEGNVTFMGRAIAGFNPRKIAALGIARSFQHVRIRADLTVLENVALGAYGRGGPGFLSAMLRLDRDEEHRILFEAQRQLDRVGLGAFAALPAGSLALGQQRLVEIARALASDPVLLLLDEPAAGLRLQEKQALADLLRQLRAEGVTMLLVEHDMDFVMSLVDRIVVLQYGRRIAMGTAQEVQRDPRVIEAYLGGIED
ncbi:metal-dependent hydrolase [Pusillimonas sp. T2]|uniref:branched-chain amino acid ABC transporter ATP-binding protein/permease n=1 Tax=Pusillimonas sp. T2 TaxID=1548123 RepID=UPI000B9CA1B6|nr:branched-chain amino acid ABC transporter ATP-binding protein/permease [Pusillimonas sp. T2]OXR50456.1 metal-dependent hydrolase [Pusillimonas sp. T2]